MRCIVWYDNSKTLKNMSNTTIDRRNFLKVLGAGTAVASTNLLYGCADAKTSDTVSGSNQGEVPTDKMTYQINSRTGDRVSLLGYGCMRWPTRQKADGSGEEIDQETVNELVDYAIAHGVNYFDTAPVYVRGMSEQATGIALSRHPRDTYFIATKLSSHHRDVPEWRTVDGVKKLLEQSMKNLQVDYLDYYLIHGVGIGGMEDLKDRLYTNGVLDFLLKEREAGRIRNLGWSFHGEVEVFDHLLACGIPWDFAQIQLNYVDWKDASGWNVNAEYLYNELVKHNVPAVIMEPLLGGRLSRLNTLMLAKIKQARPNDSPAAWSFRFSGTPEGVLTVLSGMTYMEHLQENIRTFSPLEPVTEEEKKILEEVKEWMLHSDFIPCTECQYCMPCPYGLDIPGIFAHYNRCVNDELVAKSSQDKNYREARRAFLVGYDRRVPKLRQAGHCIGCEKCLRKCTQRINIPEQMRRIDAYVEQLKQETL